MAGNNTIYSKFGYNRQYSGVPLDGLVNVDTVNVADGDQLQWDDNAGAWINVNSASSLPAPLRSIADLATVNDQMIYTVKHGRVRDHAFNRGRKELS